MSETESVKEFRRRRAVELIERGESKETIRRILGVSASALNIWIRRTIAGDDLKTKHGKGRPRRMTDKQLEQLEELLLKGAASHGWQNNLWTSLRVREVIIRHFGIEFTRSHVLHILKDYLGWSVIRPVQEAKKRNEAEIIQWKEEEFPRIEKQASKRNANLVFVDESGFMMTPTIRRTFAPRGSSPVNKVSDPHGRISIIAAISVSPKKTRLNMQYHILDDNTNYRGPSIVEFLKQLRIQVCKPMNLIWDCNIIHWADVVLQYLNTAPEIVNNFFPPYAPELNPVDRMWFYLKYDRLPNYTPETRAELRRTVESEMQRLQKQPDLLRSFIRQSEVPFVV
jgi:transposase